MLHRVSGPAADVLRQVIATDAPVGLADGEVVAGLEGAGVLVAADAPEREVGRRSFVRAAAAVGTAGVVTVALPRAAAAASDSGGESEGGSLPSEPANEIFYGDSTSGTVRVFWPSGPDVFTYSYSLTITQGTDNGSGALSGTLSSGAFVTIYQLDPGMALTGTSTSITSDVKSFTNDWSL